MLVNCPRCGLSQPNDQYCAQCGVDMQSFKQKEKPLLSKIFGNAAVQIGILIVGAVLVGQSIFRNQEQQNWFKRITHFQGISKSKQAQNLTRSESETSDDFENNTQEQSLTENSLTSESLQKDFNTDNSSESTAEPPAASAAPPAQNQQENAQNLGSMNFKITYAEVSADTLSKWISDSTNLGLYQNLNDYSAGILTDFRKRSETFQQSLQVIDLKLNLGRANSNLSGNLSPDGNRMLGLATSIEYLSNENDIIVGNINVTKGGTQGTENYPAEFALPKGAVFFIVGAIKRDHFAADRAKLTMPPFQIFKSADFMTRKTEFVIIVEPIYN